MHSSQKGQILDLRDENGKKMADFGIKGPNVPLYCKSTQNPTISHPFSDHLILIWKQSSNI